MKKQLKRIGSLFLAMLMVFNSVLTVFAADSGASEILVTGSGNLLYNGGFEAVSEILDPSANDTATLLLEGWQSMKVKGVDVTLDTEAYAGKNALRLEMQEADGGSFVLRPALCDSTGVISGLEPGVYSVSLYAKGSVGNLSVRYKDAGVKKITEKNLNLSNEWQLLRVDGMLVDEGGSIQLEIYGACTSSGFIMMDEVSLNRNPSIDNGDFELEEYVKREPTVTKSENADYTYKDTGNILKNHGFESSTSVKNVSAAWAEITEGWMPSDKATTSMYTFALSGDTHSGNNAFSVTIESITGGSREIRLFNTNANKDSTVPAKGTYENLQADTTYIASFWAKGTSTARVFGKSTNGNEWGKEYTLNSEEWTLVTKECNAYNTGAYWWNVYLKGTTVGQYAIIDDVQLVTKEQAIANVVAMIEELDVADSNVERTIKDIEQWCSVLGADNISNYQAFLNKTNRQYQYKDTGNVLTNPGFESSAGVQNVSAAWAEVTTGWMPSSEAKSSQYTFTSSEDTHSGDKAFSVTMLGNEREIRLFNSNANKNSTVPLAGTYEGLEADTTYIASFWVKGTASAARIYGKSKTNSNEWGTSFTPDSEEWTLVTKEFKSYDTGAYWWNVYLKGTADQYAIIDDIQLVTKTQAIANVIAMIDKLDVTTDYAERAIDDIEQWCAVLGTGNVENYSEFTSKKAAYVPGGSQVNPIEDKIPYWTATNDNLVELTDDTSNVKSGEKALKASFTEAGSATISTKDAPWAMNAGYYTLSFYAKGMGSVQATIKAYNDTGETVVLDKKVELSSTWSETVIDGIDIPQGYKVKSLTFTLSVEVAGDVFLDAVSMYEELGPGAALDDIVVENRGDKLYLDGAPEGYMVSLYNTSDNSVLGLDGTITTPKYDTSVDYSYVIVNTRNDKDKAVSQKHTLLVAGTEEPVEESEFSQRTLTDKATGIAVEGMMTSEAAINVRVLDKTYEDYSTALKDGYESIGFQRIYLIPRTAYSGEVTITFPVDSSYNGKEITVVQINTDTKEVTELTGTVSNGSVTIKVMDDGVFMLQLPKSVSTGSGQSSSKPVANKNTATPAETPADSSDEKTDTSNDVSNNTPSNSEDKKETSNTDNVSTGKSGLSQRDLLLLIILIGIGLIIIVVAVTLTILLATKKNKTDESQSEGVQSEENPSNETPENESPAEEIEAEGK